MFGFFAGGIAKEDAIALKKLVDLSIRQYLKNNWFETIDRIKSDFPNAYVSSDEANFVFDELRDFTFLIRKSLTGDDLEFSVFGHGKYQGFMLLPRGENWSASATDGVMSPASEGAKQLAKQLSKLYNISDDSSMFNKLHR